jgi:hypothetical protein
MFTLESMESRRMFSVGCVVTAPNTAMPYEGDVAVHVGSNPQSEPAGDVNLAQVTLGAPAGAVNAGSPFAG